MEERRIVEINGVKIEVDLRTAKTVDSYKVGDNVKVLVKSYGDSYSSYPGIIVGFDNFSELPTIILAYVDVSYSSAEIKFVYLNSKTKDIEICPTIKDELPFAKYDAIEVFDTQIAKKENELAEVRSKKAYFLEKFGQDIEGVK